MVINTSSEWAGAQGPGKSPGAVSRRKSSLTFLGLNKRDIINTFIPQIPLLLLALKSQTHLTHRPILHDPKIQTPSIPSEKKNYNSQKVLRSGGLQ